MSSISCPNCGADLSAPESVRIARHHFGHLEKSGESAIDGPGFTIHPETPDAYTILCNACRRLVRTLPLEA